MKHYCTLKVLLLQWDFNYSAFVQKPSNLEMNKRSVSCTPISSSALFSCVPTCLILREQAIPKCVYWYIYNMAHSESKMVDYKEKYIVR